MNMSIRRSRLFPRLGIRQKVLMVLMTVLLVALTLSGWFALQQEKETALNEINQRGTDITRFVAKSLAFSVVGYDYHTIQLLLDEITSSEEISYAKVLNAKGKTMGESGHYNESEFNALLMFNGEILLDTDVVGHLTIRLSADKATQRLEAQKYFLVTREAFIIMMIAITEFIALSYIIINPVKVISKSLDNGVDENGKIVAEIPLETQDEFGQLAQKFNELGRQLNEANYRLQAKIDLSDAKLRETNLALKAQSEQLKQMNEELRLMSITDALTGLFNRRHFEDLIRLEVELTARYGGKNSLLIIDIDHFKSINDTYGHVTGDSVLKTVSCILKENLRKTDVLCRVGGEEFVVLCKRAGKEESLLIAQKLVNIIANSPIPIGDEQLTIMVSVGAATIPDERTDDVDSFYRYADTALYFCKENGRNQCAHYDDIRHLENSIQQ